MTDQLPAMLAEVLKDPVARAEFEDALNRHNALDRLVARRKEEGLGQGALATTLGTSQPTLSQIEGGTVEPKVSTLQRYARAIGARVELVLIEDD